MSESGWRYITQNKSIMFDGVTGAIYDVGSITQESASNYLYELTGEGMEAGSFTTHLIRACMSADPRNLARMGLAFPETSQVARLISSAGEAGHLWVLGRANGSH